MKEIISCLVHGRRENRRVRRKVPQGRRGGVRCVMHDGCIKVLSQNSVGVKICLQAFRRLYVQGHIEMVAIWQISDDDRYTGG